MFKKIENTGAVHLAEMFYRALRRILHQKIEKNSIIKNSFLLFVIM